MIVKPADRLGRKSSDRCGFFFLYGSFDLLKRRFFYLIEGYIHSIESMGLVDGPGIRTVVFFQGCRLRCRYCHNPDTWAMRSGKEQIFTPEQLVNKLLRFKPYFGDNGGVTFSGGEPLLQKDFLCEVLRLCKHAGIHTCIDTAGCGCGGYEEILAHTDLVLLDIKHFSLDGYHSITGQSPQEFLQFLSAVQNAGTPLWIRHVVVPGLTDSDAHLEGLRAYLHTIRNIQRVELLPYHTLGVNKYHALGIPYSLEDVPALPPEALADWQQRFDREFHI
jgi:pyruvate formate-lyase 1-activating enzyme